MTTRPNDDELVGATDTYLEDKDMDMLMLMLS